MQQPEREAKPDEQPELHSESSKGRFKPITFPDTRASPVRNPPSSARTQRGTAREPATNTVHASTPTAAAKPTPTRRGESTEPRKDAAPDDNAVGTNGAAEQSGSKRKRPVIVFDPMPTAAADAPPQKRDKVELVVGVATEVTNALRINGLKRPLREADLRSILEETGCASTAQSTQHMVSSAECCAISGESACMGGAGPASNVI